MTEMSASNVMLGHHMPWLFTVRHEKLRFDSPSSYFRQRGDIEFRHRQITIRFRGGNGSRSQSTENANRDVKIQIEAATLKSII